MTLADRLRLVPEVPVLETERLLLRPLTADDLGWYLAHFSRPEIVSGSGDAAPGGLEGARDELDRYVLGLFERRQGMRWGLVPRGTDALVGSAGIYAWVDEPEPSAMVGYDLAPEWWGRGLMTEALRAIADYAFGSLGLARLEATVLTDNDRSCRTLERVGFVHAGILTEHGEDEHGRLRDEHRYVLRRPAAPG